MAIASLGPHVPACLTNALSLACTCYILHDALFGGYRAARVARVAPEAAIAMVGLRLQGSICTVLVRFSCVFTGMADKGPITIRTRKFIRNALLARRQFVSGVPASLGGGLFMIN